MISKPQVEGGLGESEHALMEALNTLADAGASVVQIRTREPLRAALVLRKHYLGSGVPYKEWDVTNGIRVFTVENYTDHKVQGDSGDIYSSLMLPLTQLRDIRSDLYVQEKKVHYFAYVSPEPYIKDNPMIVALLQQYSVILPSTNVCILLITGDEPLRDVPIGYVMSVDMSTPSARELEGVLDSLLDGARTDTVSFPDGVDITPEQIGQLARLGLGMTLSEFESHAGLAIVNALSSDTEYLSYDAVQDGIAKGKTAVVRQSEILDLTHSEDIENVGGMDRLKDWIGARANCYSDEAKEFGIEPPKGMVLVGVPGTGKSLVAKVTSSVLCIPLVRLDFGRVFSKYVGDSESRVRSALQMVESMAPVVLFVDEIDKGLGGSGEGGGDSGTASRVLGSYLTWLQECTAPVFNVVTANRVDGLPPELLRRGRFDAIFSAGMPNEDERREVLDIHLRKRGRSIDSFSGDDVEQFLRASEGYVPAEIESVVKDALINAFNEGGDGDITMTHLLDALKSVVPISKSHKAAIDRILQWAENNATSVSYPPVQRAVSTGARVIRSRRGVR